MASRGTKKHPRHELSPLSAAAEVVVGIVSAATLLLPFLMRTRIKICGLTRPADARTATDAGVDALGLIFYRSSPRAVDIGVAVEIATDVPAFTAVVGVFVNGTPQEIEEVLTKVPVTCLQFHGDESPADCERYGIPYIKTVRMQDGVLPAEIARSHPAARAILLDSYHPQKYGGTGASFSWERARDCREKPVVLAGGLNALNVAEAIMLSGAYGVDVSTGVESTPGIKDPSKVSDLVAVVRACNQAVTTAAITGKGVP
jgi:phosphoribosylanthranilate isomerase